MTNLHPLIRADSLNHTVIPAVNAKRRKFVMGGEHFVLGVLRQTLCQVLWAVYPSILPAYAEAMREADAQVVRSPEALCERTLLGACDVGVDGRGRQLGVSEPAL